ncbi:type III pantothenate kinase [Risungbinella massiliensis]|uniref:type III pantothenate kinase n=1 Tax=Risungbinella massiliensis TaxID=1329796 RepID=UPI0005CC4A68|nr:type III pantothenate kinase [Risungbinella massiliensis]
MLFVIDIGNTNIVMGVYQGDRLAYQWRVQTNRNATEDEYAMVFQNLLTHAEISVEEITGIAVSSVVPPVTYVMRKLSEKYFGQTPIILGPGVKTGLNLYCDNPREVGADRIANAVAGVEIYGAPLIIVDFGTATTFCCIDEQERYLGGAICPGVNISAEALYQRAAKLTRVEMVNPGQVIGRNTTHSVQSGIYYGYVSMVDGIVKRMKKEFQQSPKVIATGGLANLFFDDTETIDEVNPYLTLIGLKKIFERNQK